MKRCFKCERVLALDEFYKHPQMADGLLGKCKDCTRNDVQQNRRQRQGQYALYESLRQSTPQRRRKKGEYLRRHRKRHPDRNAARQAVARAVRAGRLVKPLACPCCGHEEPLQAHHDDYSKPLDVTWMCFACHREQGHGQEVLRSA